MKRIVHIIFLLIPIVLSIQYRDLPQVQEKRKGRVGNALCDYRVSSINFKCNLEFQKINMKVEMEALKAKHICMNLLERAKEKCRDLDEIDCISTTKRMKRWCQNRQDEIKLYQLRSRKLIGDVCNNAAADFKQNCPNHVLKSPGRRFRASETQSPEPPTQPTTETTQAPPTTVTEEVQRSTEDPYKSKIQEIIDYIYGEGQHSMNKQDLIIFVDKILKHNRVPEKSKEKPARSDFTEYYKLLTLPNVQSIITFIFGEHEHDIPMKDLVAFIHQIFGINDEVTRRPVTIVEHKPLLVENPEPQTIVEYIFGETPHDIPKPDQALYIQHLFDDKKDKDKPDRIILSTEPPVTPTPEEPTPVTPKPGKISPDVESIVDYVFERLKYKIDKHYEVFGKPRKFNVPSILSYLLGRYKQRIEKHNLHRNLPNLKPIQPAENQENHKNKFDISFIYKVIDELVSQEPADHVTLNKLPKKPFVSPIQFSMPTDPDFEEEDEDETVIQKPSTVRVKITKPKKILPLLTKPIVASTEHFTKPEVVTQPPTITPGVPQLLKIIKGSGPIPEGSVQATAVSGQATGETGQTISSTPKPTGASDQATAGTADGTTASSKGTEVSGKATESSGTATGSSGTATESSGKSTESSSKATETSGKASEASGTVTESSGKTTESSSKASEASGTATESSAKTTESSGKASGETSKATEASGNTTAASGPATGTTENPPGAASSGSTSSPEKTVESTAAPSGTSASSQTGTGGSTPTTGAK